MKNVMIVVLALLVFASMAVAQTYTSGTGLTGIDKLGAHQNGGRGCTGCHAPHSGVRGNGGTMAWDSVSGTFVSKATVGDVGEDVLWGQDLGPIYGTALNFPTGTLTINATSPAKQITGIAMCLSCHDGNVAKGAMMTNQAFEQQFLTAAGYGTQPIPTLLGNDGGSTGNYSNDHPVGPAANLTSIGHGAVAPYFDLNATKTGLVLSATKPDTAYDTFISNYSSAMTSGAPSYAGWAFDVASTTGVAGDAYVVCTTCHTPHSMYVWSGTAATVKGNYPTYFFLNAPYNPAPTGFPTDGSKASSATQFCRACHFKGAGGSNEASGISIPTAF